MYERLLARLLGCSILTLGLLHFALPSLFRWEVVLTREPMLAWGLLMLNFATSWQFIIVGALVLLHHRRKVLPDLIWHAWVVFWLGMCIYLGVRPMPTSSVLGTLAPSGFSLFQVGGAMALLMFRRRSVDPPSEV